MKKVVIENSVNVDVMIEKMMSEVEYDYDFVRKYVLENGSGIYEFSFSCEVGLELEKFIKNDEYLSLDELVEEELVWNKLEKNDNNIKECMEYLSEFYSEDDRYILENENFVKYVSFRENDFSIFVNVTV